MIIWLLLSALCFFLFKRFINKIEINDYGEWQPFTAPLWFWCLAICIALLPVFNFIALFCFELFCVDDIRDSWNDTRFKQGENCLLNKFLDLMNKKF
jgi:hypothetical protein